MHSSIGRVGEGGGEEDLATKSESSLYPSTSSQSKSSKSHLENTLIPVGASLRDSTQSLRCSIETACVAHIGVTK